VTRAATRPIMLRHFALLALVWGLWGATLGAQQPLLPADCTLEASAPSERNQLVTWLGEAP